MRNRIAVKLRSRAGESIGETLVALLISALALLILAGAISAATRVVTQSRAAMTNYYAADAQLVRRTALKGANTIVLKDKTTSGELFSFPVDTYENSALAGKPVIAYAPTTP